MPSFSRTSLTRLDTCHPSLQEVLKEAINIIDFSVVCGHRDEKDQNEAYLKKMSQLKYPESKHNKIPSLAVDIWPYNNTLKEALSGHPDQIRRIAQKLNKSYEEVDAYIKEEFLILMGVIKAVAHYKGIKLRFGSDWDGDGFRLDQSFNDYPHIELQ